MRGMTFFAALILAAAPTLARAGEENLGSTRVLDSDEKGMLLGEHDLTLQWVSWDKPGKAEVKEHEGTLSIEGEQRDLKTGDYLTVSGRVVEVGKRTFVLDGEVVMRVSHINQGKPCARSGRLHFVRTGKRRYWRMREMDNPCDGVTDYVDLYLRAAAKL
ncbi:MAG: hypothetical protein HYZ28_25060 [Myxococcales bacterium]|nr:hypothetical protein [Myxococcales bacterium]